MSPMRRLALRRPALRRPALRRPALRRHPGQALVEFAVVIPIFLVLLIGLFDFGRVIWANNSLASAATEGARFAIVHGGSQATACPVGPPGPETIIPAPSATCPYPAPSKEAIRDVVRQYAIAPGGPMTIQVCYGAGCSGDTDVADATNVRGTSVTVTVRSNVSLIVGTLLGARTFGIEGSSTMLVNH
jgi:hypothetical protein